MARREEYRLHVSRFAIDEAGAGDRVAARRRIELVKSAKLLVMTNEATALARDLSKELGLPRKAATDAFHLGVAAVHGIDFLLTWNLRHIANAELRDRIEDVIRDGGFRPPTICTPEQLMGGLSK